MQTVDKPRLLTNMSLICNSNRTLISTVGIEIRTPQIWSVNTANSTTSVPVRPQGIINEEKTVKYNNVVHKKSECGQCPTLTRQFSKNTVQWFQHILCNYYMAKQLPSSRMLHKFADYLARIPGPFTNNSRYFYDSELDTTLRNW
jgi:hypothetical protein